MQAFSSVLSELYQAAESLHPDDFQLEAFRLFRKLVFYDGGLCGSAQLPARSQSGMHIAQALSYGRSDDLLHDYKSVVADDPVARRLLNSLTMPYSCACLQLYKERQLLRLFAFAKKHEIAEVMVFGDNPTNSGLFRWISLYRRASHPFDAEDAMILKAWWTHLVRTTSLNLRHALERLSENKRDKAVALLDALGHIQVGDRLFADMLSDEWPKEQGRRLPKPAWTALVQKGIFRGHTICLTAVRHNDYTICEAKRLSEIDRLGTLERSVALLVVQGHDYKTIAARMGTSPNTVRNQISRIYKKLNVHDKLSLALLFHRSEHFTTALASSAMAPSLKLTSQLAQGGGVAAEVA